MTVWKESKLGDEIELIYGKGLPKHSRSTGKFPVFGSNGIVGHHSEALVKGPGIIVGRKGSCGEVHYSESDFWPIDTTYYVALKKKHDLRFLYYYLKTLGLTEKNSHSTIPGLNRELTYELNCKIPKNPEQQKIAAILFKIQQAIEAQEKIIETTRELKKATMHHVFTYGLRGEKTKETDFGRIPESWQIKQLGDLVEVKGGKRLPLGRQLTKGKTPYPYIRVCDFKNNSVAIEQLMFVPPEVQPQIRQYIINHQDIYISIAGTTGLVGIIPLELDGAQLTENAARLIKDSDGPDQKYLMRFLDSDYGQNQIESMTMKTSQPKLALARIKNIKIAIAPHDEQIEIAQVLYAIDSKTELHMAKKSALQDLFKTMLNKLMTNEIRVKDLKIDISLNN